MKEFDVKKLTSLGLLTAIVVVLQLLGSFIRFGPFSISLVLVPIVIGAALYGPAAGCWLGLVFGVTVLLSGDAAAFLAVSIPGTILTVLGKGAAAGAAAGWVYRLCAGKNETQAVMLSACAAPIANTGCFLIGCLLFFMGTLAGWAEGAGFGTNVFGFMIIGLVGGNFIVELIANVVLAPVILRLIKMVRRSA